MKWVKPTKRGRLDRKEGAEERSECKGADAEPMQSVGRLHSGTAKVKKRDDVFDIQSDPVDFSSYVDGWPGGTSRY